MSNNFKQWFIEDKNILASTYIRIPLHQFCGKEALFQKLYTVLIQNVPVIEIWMKNSTTSVKYITE